MEVSLEIAVLSKALEPTAVGRPSSAIAGYVIRRLWLSFHRSAKEEKNFADSPATVR